MSKTKLAILVAVLAVVVPLTASAGIETVRKDCNSMSSWYECRDIRTAPPLVQDGYNIIHNTPTTLGPSGNVKGADGRPIVFGSYSCDSCHFDGGQVPGGIPFFQVRDKYSEPGTYWPAGDRKRLMRERINWCLVSCANGQFLPEDSYSMDAMVAYMEWVAEGITDPAMLGHEGYKNIPGHDLPAMPLTMKANVTNGRQIYQNRCDECHGDRGPGQGRYDEGANRARVPALWGANGASYTKGAQGMHTVPQLSTLIKKFMPLGEANLTDQQALDVSGYINTQPRDSGFFTEKYFGPSVNFDGTVNDGMDDTTGVPNIYTKPSYFAVGVDMMDASGKMRPDGTRVDPYTGEQDPFPASQWLLGPWQPIADHLTAKKNAWLATHPVPAP
jgi:thiosulfate dehydrogenase